MHHISWKPSAPPAIVRAASDGALDEFLSEETPAAPQSVSRHEPPLFKHVDARVPEIDLANYEIRSIVPPAARSTRSHGRAPRVAQSLVGALLALIAVRGYEIYVRPIATEPKVIATEPKVITVPAPAQQNPEPVADATSPVAERAPDRANTHAVTRAVPHDAAGVVRKSLPAPLDPQAAAAFWRSRGAASAVPSTPASLPSGGPGPALDGAPLGAAPSAPPPTRVTKAPIPVASPPTFLAPSSPVEVTPLAGAAARAADSAAIESVLARYRAAFANLDASAVAALWPSVDARALSRTFDQLEAQTFEFDRCTTDIKNLTAVTSCNGRARYAPRVNNKTPRVEPRRWTFTLEKIDQTWIIRRVESTKTG